MTAGLAEEVAEILADEHTRLIVPDDVATKADVHAVSADLGHVKTDLEGVKADIEGVKAELGRVNADIEGVKAELGRVKADIEDVKAELGRVKADIEGVKAELGRVKADIDAVKADLEIVKAQMVTKADLQREIAACEARMEQRLQNAILEAKVSLIKWMIATMAVFSGIVIGAMTALQ